MTIPSCYHLTPLRHPPTSPHPHGHDEKERCMAYAWRPEVRAREKLSKCVLNIVLEYAIEQNSYLRNTFSLMASKQNLRISSSQEINIPLIGRVTCNVKRHKSSALKCKIEAFLYNSRQKMMLIHTENLNTARIKQEHAGLYYLVR